MKIGNQGNLYNEIIHATRAAVWSCHVPRATCHVPQTCRATFVSEVNSGQRVAFARLNVSKNECGAAQQLHTYSQISLSASKPSGKHGAIVRHYGMPLNSGTNTTQLTRGMHAYDTRYDSDTTRDTTDIRQTYGTEYM